MKRGTKLLAIAAMAGTMALPLYAMADADDIRGLAEAKITLIDAINAAEKHVGGKAYDAGFDDDSFKPAFEVNVAKDGKSFDVRVDGLTGEILGSREDIDD